MERERGELRHGWGRAAWYLSKNRLSWLATMGNAPSDSSGDEARRGGGGYTPSDLKLRLIRKLPKGRYRCIAGEDAFLTGHKDRPEGLPVGPQLPPRAYVRVWDMPTSLPCELRAGRGCAIGPGNVVLPGGASSFGFPATGHRALASDASDGGYGAAAGAAGAAGARGQSGSRGGNGGDVSAGDSILGPSRGDGASNGAAHVRDICVGTELLVLGGVEGPEGVPFLYLGDGRGGYCPVRGREDQPYWELVYVLPSLIGRS